jgi:hypothetical protein
MPVVLVVALATLVVEVVVQAQLVVTRLLIRVE